MKWKLPLEPKEGDIRTRTKFAWTPTYVYRDTECYKVLFETYRVTEVCQRVKRTYEPVYYELKWKIIKREPLFGDHE